MTTDQLRAAFLEFFERQGHKVLPSSSLIPHGDPTLLLTSAGMVQIKPYFLGEAVPPAHRLASCQKCFRATDIESVGDSTHLTFFEMLGNFSVGDYFKKEAIAWAWEFVTGDLAIPRERLWITVFTEDDEAFRIWRRIGVPENRIVRLGEKDNFWGPAGSSGPCGPCSEIHYDFGEGLGCGQPNCAPGCECGRFSEIWNLVFTEYNQDESGRRTRLPSPNIDTGMGLERTAAVLQGKDSVYEIDLFQPLVEKVAQLSGVDYGSNNDRDNAVRIIAEHSRGITFLIADGVLPGNEGRGYVLRRLLRRAALFGRRLGLDKPFLAETARVTIEQMGHTYPELAQRQDFINKVIDLEEARFGQTLDAGLNVINGVIDEARKSMVLSPSIQQAISEMAKIQMSPIMKQAISEMVRIGPALEQATKAMKAMTIPPSIQQAISEMAKIQMSPIMKQAIGEMKSLSRISGREAFQLYDTYGFPRELTQEVAAENGFSIDAGGFEKEMEEQREKARAAHKFDVSLGDTLSLKGKVSVRHVIRFVGYQNLNHKADIIYIRSGDESPTTITEGQEADLILESTPFYGEMGGQLGDTGKIIGHNGVFQVTDTVRGITDLDVIIHEGKVIEGVLAINDEVEAVVDVERRLDIARNHTATHLLQYALRHVLGEQVQQRGSLVAPDRFRFDFSHLEAMSVEEIKKVQQIVNQKIRENHRVYDEKVAYQQAVAEGAIALFEEKYGDVVRVLKIGEPAFSVELCGGTHVSSTGEIGYFQIIGESSIGAGLRRIEAVTGRGAEEFLDRRLSDLQKAAEYLDAELDDVSDKAYALSIELDKERKRALSLEKKLARKEAEALVGSIKPIKGINVLSARVSSTNQQVMREMADYIRDYLQSVIVVLGSVYENRPVFVAAVTPDLVAKGYDAGKIVGQVARVTGGGGGGKPTLAQAGGRDKSKLDEALRLVESLV